MTSTRRRFFGPSKAEIWRQLSADIGGTYTKSWRGDKVQAVHGEWTVTLDTFVVPAGKVHIPFTRMRAPYVNPGDFRFSIYRKTIFSGIATVLGMQDVEIGDPAFDDLFVIKGSHESRVRALFSDVRIRQLVVAQPEIHLTVQDDEGWFGATFPDGVDELYFAVPGVIKDVERLTHLYELFGLVLDQLCDIGSAYERNPGVQL
jgi:hypothetical protein